MQRGLRVIPLQRSIKKSPILLSQYWKIYVKLFYSVGFTKPALKFCDYLAKPHSRFANLPQKSNVDHVKPIQ